MTTMKEMEEWNAEAEKGRKHPKDRYDKRSVSEKNQAKINEAYAERG